MTQILDLSDKWLQHPELYYPEPKTIINCIKWHIAMMKLIDKKYGQGSTGVKDASEIKISSEIKALDARDMNFFAELGYCNIARIETAMMLGRELWFKENKHFSEYEAELKTISIDDLDAWREVFEIPAYISEGGNINSAIEYTLGKRPEFLQAYIDAYEKTQRGESK